MNIILTNYFMDEKLNFYVLTSIKIVRFQKR